MISTLLNYRLYTNDMARTLERLETQSQIERARSYYDENIGKVGSVDELLDDYKLYSYAMKAYGLEDQIPARGLMRKVLESDLTDAGSFANKLVDKRYREFASAFSFASASAAPAVQSTSQRERLTEAYGERVDRSGPLAAAEAAYVRTAMAAAPSVDAFVADRRLVNFALKAAGVADPALYGSDYVGDVLKGAVTGTLSADFATLKTLTNDLFSADVATRDKALSTLIYSYNNETGNGSSPQALEENAADFKARLPGMTTDQMADDARMRTFLLTSVGFQFDYLPERVKVYLGSEAAIAGSDLSDVDKQRFRTLRNWLGSANGGVADIEAGYRANFRNKAESDDRLATNSYLVAIAKVKTVSDLMAGDNVSGRRTTLSFVLRSFDIDPDTVSLSQIRAVLTSDPSDPGSYVSKLKDERFSRLAGAFNFDAEGRLRPERLVQSTTQQTKTGSLYAATFKDPNEAQKAIIKADTQNYLEAIAGTYSLDGFLADRKTVNYALRAYGVEKGADMSTDTLRRILSSDLSDPASFANAHADKAVAKFAAAFRFEPDGSVADGNGGAQDGASRLATDRLYLLQTLEGQAGEVSEGTRLALYFLRKAPDATTSYAILADKALFQVARTALGLPEGMTSMDIEKQAAILDKRLNFDDFKDPESLDRFVARFAAMYDLANTDASSSPILQLFGTSGGTGGILSLF